MNDLIMNKWVISIGSNEIKAYKNLDCAYFNALDIYNSLSYNWKCNDEHKVLLTGRYATSKNILITLNDILIRKAKENDKILLYFSGYIEPSIRSITSCFITHDFSKKDKNYGINLKSLRYLIEDSLAKFIVVIIDGYYPSTNNKEKYKIPHWLYFTTDEMNSEIITKLFITSCPSDIEKFYNSEKRNSYITEIIISLIQETWAKNERLSTSLFFDLLSKRVKERNILYPAKSGIEVGYSTLIFPQKIKQNIVFDEIGHYIPLWLKDSFSANEEFSSNDRCTFVQDNNYPDGSLLNIGQTIIKSWRVRNDGNIKWKNRYLKIVGDPRGAGRIHAPILIPISNAEQGEEIDINVELIMPPYPGSVYAEFKMVDVTGTYCFPNRKGLYVCFDIIDLDEQSNSLV